MNYAKFDGHDEEQDPKRLDLPIPWPFPQKLEKLTGTLTKFKAVYSNGPFCSKYYSKIAAHVKEKAQGISGEEIGAVLWGLTGHGVTAMTSLAEGSEFEPAMYIFAELNGKRFKGWLGYCEFKAGDEVEIVAEWTGKYYEVYAMIRLRDEIITVYPECYSGLNATRKTVFTGYLIVSAALWLFGFVLGSLAYIGKGSFKHYIGGEWLEVAMMCFVIAFVVMGGVAGVDNYRSFKKTRVVLAEHIFTTLGWQDVRNINLMKMSHKIEKRLKKEGKYPKIWELKKHVGKIPAPKDIRWAMFYYYDPDVVYGRKKH